MRKYQQNKVLKALHSVLEHNEQRQNEEKAHIRVSRKEVAEKSADNRHYGVKHHNTYEYADRQLSFVKVEFFHRLTTFKDFS